MRSADEDDRIPILPTAFEESSEHEADAGRDTAAAVHLITLDDPVQEPQQPVPDLPRTDSDSDSGASEPSETTSHDLPHLEALARTANPKLVALLQTANAAAAKTRYVDRLPDPTVGVNAFGHPIETAAGSQRASLAVKQLIPWLDRLNAQQQQAAFEAMVLRQKYAAERLRVTGDLRARYYQLYVLARQIETVEANQLLLQQLIDIIMPRVETGNATQGDVLLAELERDRLEEQLITLHQRVKSTQADINRLVNRPADTPVAVPDRLDVSPPDWSHGLLVGIARERQPVIAAAQLQSHATRWGVRVAELRRRPDLQIGATWFFTDSNRPASPIVDIGRDAWSIGATVSLPLDHAKYDAIEQEALWKHAASRSLIQDTLREFDARLLDLLEQARAAAETSRLYVDTIIPDAQQTLEADLDSLSNGAVEFDRVIKDFRSLLTLEFGYHRAVGDLAIAIARIRQAVGVDLEP